MDEVDLIKQKINIVDLIQEYLPLKKTGINFKANCPFHQEKTPSFVVSPERGIWHCFGCFPPGELIKTPFGYHKIEEIDKNHWVVSGKGNLRKVTDVVEHQYKGDLISVRLRKLGGIVRLTADHNVFVIRGAPYTRKYKTFSRKYKTYLKIKTHDEAKYWEKINRYFPLQKIQAGEMQVGDLLVYPVNRQVADIKNLKTADFITKKTKFGPIPKPLPEKLLVNNNLLKLLGYYIAEGSNHRAYIRFSLGNHEQEFAKEICALVKRIFGLEASIHLRSKNKTGIEITACNSKLADLFENLCGKGASNKHIPFILQELPTQKQRVLLEAIIKGDGTKYKASKSLHTHRSITSISKVLKEQIVDILLRLNFFPTVSVHKARTGIDNINHKEAYYISWSEESKQKYSLLYHQQDGSEYWLLPITSITAEYYKGPVHNFTVEHDHSYVATNFAVGNCDKGGDHFKFLMEKEGMDFKESLEFLAKKAGITLKKSTQGKNPKDRLYEINQKAQQFFSYMLLEHPLGKKALEYLQKRGLKDKTIKDFGLGYAPQNWETLTSFLKKRGFSEKELIDSGLAVPSKRGCYDRFRGRIMFPLIDTQGKIIGFAGRVLGKSESPKANLAEGGPKYINTPQTAIFDKGKFLFGLQLSKSDIREKKEAILVEGEMDMLMSYQQGVKNIVASKGTALTEDQIDILKKYTQTLSLCFDADLAGDAASRRGIEIADKAGLNIKVIEVAGGKDPADICLKDSKDWEKMVKESIPIYDYYLTSASKRYDPKTAVGKRGIFTELLPIWKKISDSMTKEHYIQKLASLLQTKDELIRIEIEKQPNPAKDVKNILKTPEVPKKEIIEVRDRRKLLEEYLLVLLVHLPVTVTYVPNFPETLFTQESLKQIYVLLVIYLDKISFKGKAFKIADFVKFAPEQLIEQIDRLYLTEIDERLDNPTPWQKELDSVISELKKMLIKSSLEKLSLEIKNAQSFDKIEALDILNKRFRDLSVKLKNL